MQISDWSIIFWQDQALKQFIFHQVSINFRFCKNFKIFLGDLMDVFDAAERYHKENISMIILAGKDYGSGMQCFLACAVFYLIM